MTTSSITTTYFIANDGTKFNSELLCTEYELLGHIDPWYEKRVCRDTTPRGRFLRTQLGRFHSWVRNRPGVRFPVEIELFGEVLNQLVNLNNDGMSREDSYIKVTVGDYLANRSLKYLPDATVMIASWDK